MSGMIQRRTVTSEKAVPTPRALFHVTSIEVKLPLDDTAIMARDLSKARINLKPSLFVTIFDPLVSNSPQFQMRFSLRGHDFSGTFFRHFDTIVNDEVLLEVLHQAGLCRPMFASNVGMNFFTKMLHVKEMNKLK